MLLIFIYDYKACVRIFCDRLNILEIYCKKTELIHISIYELKVKLCI
jgi:hypothetical protein